MVIIKKTKKTKRYLVSYKLVFAFLWACLFYLFYSFNKNEKIEGGGGEGGGSLRAQLDSSMQSLNKGTIAKNRDKGISFYSNNIDKEDASEEREKGKNDNTIIDDNNDDDDSPPSAGTHAENNFFFADYLYDRENPPFRYTSVENWDNSYEAILADMPELSSLSIRSCHYKSDDHSILIHAGKCLLSSLEDSSKLIAFNPAEKFARSWCGITIPPRKAVLIDTKACNKDDPVRLFPLDKPPIDGKGMPPIVVTSIPGISSSNKNIKDVECDIPCKHEANMEGPFLYIEGVDWKISQSIRDPARDKNAEVEQTSFREDIYYSTTSFKSSVPLSHFSFDEYDLFTPALEFDQVNASGTYMLNTQCSSHFTKRNRWAEAVLEQIWVANYGKCAHNTDPPNGLKISEKSARLGLMKKHRFNLALEFGDRKDHITPIVWEAFSSGTVPVIIGAQNIQDHFPVDSFISNSGLQHYGDLGHRVARIVKDKVEWERYQKWRTDPEAKQIFEMKYNFTRTSSECRVCRWAYAKQYGLGWSHTQQYVHETTIQRNLCLDRSQNLVARPFRESWQMTSGNTNHDDYIDIRVGADSSTCVETTSSILEITNSFALTRTVKFHDNVIDMEFTNFDDQPPQKDIILQFEIPIQNAYGSSFPNPHTLVQTMRGISVSSIALQDRKSKAIIIANWNTKITCPRKGIVEVVVRKSNERWINGDDERRSIRVILEDLVELYDKSTEFYPTSFAKLMIQDFVDPLELFYFE
mmetsp:Transcript_32014/g.35469  ORF Transcript_32014/g.35469 Transcript_32014/m.35469 type:complete len:752 (+) Transcript_32014:23-2278(+)|eukprot:CAMPEP_0194165000 /NCGR_PEP_ID=MMETSP0154-20130528/1036_1 /TAXON_ID=1049557 /ORGANISM="Thalassiothrix antarctica, Strain L6-D1" /LENGTH=751 /DNA_ID=CAMNT_0038875343 /DNA_START=16 /DNA_END=2271 /DNA_ORIENTATION=-